MISELPAGRQHPERAAFGKVLLNEARLAWRAPRGLIFGVGLPAVLVVIFGALPKDQVRHSTLGGLTRFDVEVPVLIAFVIAIMALYSPPVPLASYREQGILRRLSATPARPSWVLAAQVVVNLVFALAGLLIVVVVGATAFGESAPKTLGGFVLAIAASLAAARQRLLAARRGEPGHAGCSPWRGTPLSSASWPHGISGGSKTQKGDPCPLSLFPEAT